MAGMPERSGTSKASLASEMRGLGLLLKFLFPACGHAFGQDARVLSSNSPPRIVDTPSARKVFHIHGRVETVTTEMRARIQIAQTKEINCAARPSGSVHRQIDCDQLGVANRGFIECLPRQVEGDDVVAALAKPRRGRGQAKGCRPSS